VTYGLDLLGPFRKAPGGYTHLLIIVDKFAKWIEAKPITRVRSEDAVEFFLDIVYRFGVPNFIITDNGTLLTRNKFLQFCDDNGIRIDWASMAHPRTNGQVECANALIL